MKDTTTAQDIMSTKLVTLKVGDTVEDALKALINRKITGLPVVDQKGRMVGVLSDLDLIRQLSGGEKTQAFHAPIQFTKEAFSLPPTAPLETIVKHLLASKFRRIPIVDKKRKLVGIVTRRDLMRLYFYRAKLT
jgi:CBS domain-containing protein